MLRTNTFIGMHDLSRLSVNHAAAWVAASRSYIAGIVHNDAKFSGSKV